MTEAVLVAIVTATGAVMVALLGIVTVLAQRTRASARRTEASAKAAQHQVQNDHKENLRDDLDGKHDATIQALEAFRNEYQDDQRAIFAELRGLREDDSGQRRRIANIEDTMPSQSMFEPPRKGKHS